MNDPRVFAAFDVVWRQEVELLTALLADIEADRPHNAHAERPAQVAKRQANRDRFFAAIAAEGSNDD